MQDNSFQTYPRATFEQASPLCHRAIGFAQPENPDVIAGQCNVLRIDLNMAEEWDESVDELLMSGDDLLAQCLALSWTDEAGFVDNIHIDLMGMTHEDYLAKNDYLVMVSGLCVNKDLRGNRRGLKFMVDVLRAAATKDSIIFIYASPEFEIRGGRVTKKAIREGRAKLAAYYSQLGFVPTREGFMVLPMDKRSWLPDANPGSSL